MKLSVSEAKEKIEKLGRVQLKSDSVFLCPRCSKERMKKRISTNALSRYADVYICDMCGTDEAILDTVGRQLPLNEWGCVRDKKNI